MLDVNGAFRSVTSVKKKNERTHKEYYQISAVHNFSVRDESGNWKQASTPLWVNFQYYKDIPKNTAFTGSFSSRPWLAPDGNILINWTPNWVIINQAAPTE